MTDLSFVPAARSCQLLRHVRKWRQPWPGGDDEPIKSVRR